MTSCLYDEELEKKRFRGSWLRIVKAVDPELITWPNWSLSKTSRSCRIVAYVLFQIAILIISYVIVLQLENLDLDLGKTVPSAPCPKKVTEAEAFKDLSIKDSVKRSGQYHCFCKSMFEKETYGYIRDYKFSQDKKTHCHDWFVSYYGVQVLGLVIPATVGVINIGVEVIIGYASEFFARPVNLNKSIADSMRGISGIQFLNLGLLFLILSHNKKLGFMQNPYGFLTGSYEQMTALWYLEFGSLVVKVMIVEIAFPHALPVAQRVFFGCWRCCDRGCACDCDERKSKQLLQADYEWLYIGPEFQLDARLA